MITRIVRLTIQPDKVEDFKLLFSESFPKISRYNGCRDLMLYQDYDESNVMITYSNWNSVEDLETYRKSELFRTTWDKVKPLFSSSPMAFSMERSSF